MVNDQLYLVIISPLHVSQLEERTPNSTKQISPRCDLNCVQTVANLSRHLGVGCSAKKTPNTTMPKQDDLMDRSLGRSSPKTGSRRDSRDFVHWEYDSSPESDNYRRGRDRPSRKTSIRDRNFFTDALDDLEISIRKFEEESSVLLHDFVSIFICSVNHVCFPSNGAAQCTLCARL